MNGQRRFPLSTQAVHRGDNADAIADQILVQLTQFSVATDKVLVAAAQAVASGRELCQQAAVQPSANSLVNGFKPCGQCGDVIGISLGVLA